MPHSLPTSNVAVVLGATGAVGGAVAFALQSRGWRIKALHRDPNRAAEHCPLSGIDWIKGDAMSQGDVVGAAAGARLIVHAVNPPGYRKWRQFQAPMLENTIAAAQTTGARIVLPGCLYNFGPDAGGLVTEASPQHPLTRKGAIKAQMEVRLSEAGVKALVVRAGDFFGPGATASSWFAQVLGPVGQPPSITYPGDPKVGHAWAYLPDLAETIAGLVERDGDLETFSVFHFGGHWLERGETMADVIARCLGARSVRRRAFPWLAVTALSPVVPLFRELLEMRYLWKRPLRLDNTKLTQFLGAEVHTPLEAAVVRALTSLGRLAPDRSVSVPPAEGRAQSAKSAYAA